jgi:hypothetical protein
MKPEEKILKMDIDDEKKYAAMMLDVSAKMPDMIARMETGYGVKKRSTSKETEVMSSIENVRDRLT